MAALDINMHLSILSRHSFCSLHSGDVCSVAGLVFVPRRHPHNVLVSRPTDCYWCCRDDALGDDGGEGRRRSIQEKGPSEVGACASWKRATAQRPAIRLWNLSKTVVQRKTCKCNCRPSSSAWRSSRSGWYDWGICWFARFHIVLHQRASAWIEAAWMEQLMKAINYENRK